MHTDFRIQSINCCVSVCLELAIYISLAAWHSPVHRIRLHWSAQLLGEYAPKGEHTVFVIAGGRIVKVFADGLGEEWSLVQGGHKEKFGDLE